MSAYNDSFILFRNDKDGNEKRPDYKGKLNVGGKEFEIAAWIRDGEKGKFMTGKVSEPRQKPAQQQPAQQQIPEDFNDDLPF